VAVLTIADDEIDLAERLADRFEMLLDAAIRATSTAIVCLTGGNTPRRLYQLLASEPRRDRIAWERLQVFWSDERHVPPEHQDSNYRMAREALIMHVPIPASHIHRIRGELPPEDGARLYEAELTDRFDVTLLGLGEDAHIASLFPDSPAIHETVRRVAAPWVSHLDAYRITLTPPALLTSAHILMLVSGAAKARAVAAAFEEPSDPGRFPVHVLRPAGDRVEWFTDRVAAQGLSSPRAR
jgi:6-phosphogluconolactonase